MTTTSRAGAPALAAGTPAGGMATLPPAGTSWKAYGLCAQTDPEVFFPEKGGSTRDAKQTCMACEVKVQCLEYALSNDERFGVWGGLSERERRRLRRSRTGTTLAA